MQHLLYSAFSLLLFSVALTESGSCFKLFCDSDPASCQPCDGVTPQQLHQWKRYVDVLLQSFKDTDESTASTVAYYKQLRDHPVCCNPKDGDYCTLSLINEPKVPPYRLYELGCRRRVSFWHPAKCKLANGRCCNSTLCNLPTDEEISRLVDAKPKDTALIASLTVISILILIVLIGICCVWRCKSRSACDKYHQAHVTVGDTGDHVGYRPQTDALLWPEPILKTVGVASLPGGSSIEMRSPLLPGGMATSSSGMPMKPSSIPGPGHRPVHYGGGSSFQSSGLNSFGGAIPVVNRGSDAGGGSSYMGTNAMPSSIGSFPLASYSAPSGAGPCMDQNSSGSGSGAGPALLVERTVARDVRLESRIGEGRYGDVWLGRLAGDAVAVKIFSSRNENSWVREKQIYETATLRHTNILGFIAADNKDNGMSTELWLITEYHQLGSLYEFLQEHAFTLPALAKMASSLVNGLAHLHMSITGTSGKPAIAHRDLKSRNILVKADGECCIGDLGFAVKLDPCTGQVDVAHNPERVGTKRYMAPEVLDNTLRDKSFDAYMLADMYSLGLVLWEMTRRVYVPNVYGPEEYQLPYQGIVASDPLVEEMKSVVCEQGHRPHLPPAWHDHTELLHHLYNIMTECWSANPSVRLSAMRVKKDLGIQRQQLGPPAAHLSSADLPEHILRQQPPTTLHSALPPGVFVYRSEASGNESMVAAATAPTSFINADSLSHQLHHHPGSGGSVQPPNVVATTAANL